MSTKINFPHAQFFTHLTIFDIIHEEWLPIDGFANYQVSDLGRVRRVAGFSCPLGRMLKPILRKDGYLVYGLTKNGQSTMKLAHQIVAETFMTKPGDKYEVSHLNDDKRDNRSVVNLQWATHKVNMNNNNCSAFSSRLKSIAQYTKDGVFVKYWKSATDVENELDISRTAIYIALAGKTKSSGGFIWKRG